MNNLKFNILLITLFFSTFAFAQKFTTINKNLNSSANGFKHDLNSSGDSIIMKSDKQIYRISFLSHKQKESVEIDLGSLEANIPLYHFEEGRYTVEVYREDMIIDFDIV
ncbi:MAG: hypothetical protein WBF67_07765, partial [Olleya sp.]